MKFAKYIIAIAGISSIAFVFQNCTSATDGSTPSSLTSQLGCQNAADCTDNNSNINDQTNTQNDQNDQNDQNNHNEPSCTLTGTCPTPKSNMKVYLVVSYVNTEGSLVSELVSNSAPVTITGLPDQLFGIGFFVEDNLGNVSCSFDSNGGTDCGGLINNSAIGSFDAFALVNQPAKYNFTLSDGVATTTRSIGLKISGSSKQNTRFGFRMGIRIANVPDDKRQYVELNETSPATEYTYNSNQVVEVRPQACEGFTGSNCTSHNLYTQYTCEFTIVRHRDNDNVLIPTITNAADCTDAINKSDLSNFISLGSTKDVFIVKVKGPEGQILTRAVDFIHN